MSEQQLRDLARFAESDAFDETERMVLELCTTMSRTPADVPAELFEKLKLRFSAEEIVELVTAISLENFRARFNRPFDVASENVSQGAYCALPER